MTGENREFKATKGLLKDVMRKQAGSVEKAILEAVMNAVDAGATVVSIEIKKGVVIIEDNGGGITEVEISEYFEQFGYEDDDVEDKEFGKFRLGRGQIFNFGKNVWQTRDNVLVVDLNNDSATVEVDGEVQTVDTEGLSYTVLEQEEFVDGTSISIELYDRLDDPNKVVKEVRKLTKYIPWLHDIELTVNGEEAYEELDVDVETQLAYYAVDEKSYGSSTRVYNKGAFVQTDSITNSPGTIVTKEDLDINLARNDILDTCEIWNDVVAEYEEATADRLLETDELSDVRVRWLLNYAANNEKYKTPVMDKQLVPDCENTRWSINDLKSEKVTFANTRSNLASDIQRMGKAIVISERFENEVKQFIESSSTVSFGEVIDKGMKFEMNEIEAENLDDVADERLAILQDALQELGITKEVKAGFSKKRDMWQNGEEVVIVTKGLLKETPSKFVDEVLFNVVREACFEGDTRQERDDTWTVHKDFWRYSESLPEVQQKVREQL